MNVGMIGAGKLGLSFALLAEKKGIEILGSDVSEQYVDLINNKTLKSLEPNIENYLSTSKNFRMTTDNLAVIRENDLIFTFVQTPSDGDNGGYIHDYVEKIIDDFHSLHKMGHNLNGKVFVVGCTTMPGYVDTVYKRLSKYGMDVCYNPEFIAQGDIINGLEYSDIVLIGSSSDDASDMLRNFYNTLMSIEPNFKFMSNTAAEITKISINCFLTTKISFANMMGEICVESGIGDEINKVLSAIGGDTRVGTKYLNYGFGFGGPCLPRDNRALGKHMKKIGLTINLPYEVDKFNEEHNKFLTNEFSSRNSGDDTYIFTSVSYKKGIDIIEESQQLKLAISLLNIGYNVHIDDDIRIISLIKNDLSKRYGNKVTFSTNNELPVGIIVNL